MKVITLKRKKLIPQLEAAHLGAMLRLRRAFPCDESLAVFTKVDRVQVELSERLRTCAGKAWSKIAKIHLNARLLAVNPDELIPTYLHELAHVVANQLYEKQCGHGPEWKAIMKIFGAPDDTYHKMDVSAFRAVQRRFDYECVSCDRNFKLSMIRHKKQQHSIATKDSGRYICPCGGTIEHKP
jgi:predicted SprT family Zn-dependent metalloprotease